MIYFYLTHYNMIKCDVSKCDMIRYNVIYYAIPLKFLIILDCIKIYNDMI